MTEPDSADGGPGARLWDVHWKRLVHVGLDAVLAELGLAIGGSRRSVSVILPAGERRADHLFQFPGGLLVHVEIQQGPARDMPVRMIEYAVRIPQSSASGCWRRWRSSAAVPR